MLGSDNEAEILATVAALKRVLASSGKNMNDLLPLVQRSPDLEEIVLNKLREYSGGLIGMEVEKLGYSARGVPRQLSFIWEQWDVGVNARLWTVD